MPSYTRESPDAPKKQTHATVMPCGVPRPSQAKERELAKKRRDKRKELEAANQLQENNPDEDK